MALEEPVPASFGDHALMLAAPSRSGQEAFIVADPGARVSAAWRLNTDRTDAAGGVPEPTAGYLMTSRIIVETDNQFVLARALRLRAGQRNAAAPSTRGAGVGGFTIVETDSIAESISLALELRASGAFSSVELDIERPHTLRGTLPSDPLFPSQWHLLNTVNAVADINAEAAWSLGYTGQGVVIGVTEGGFQSSHPDISAHYNSAASQGSGSSGHATSVAGVFGAIGDNGVGVTGLAYNCGLSSQLIGSGSQNATAFTFRNDLNDIKNDSWGPWDTGELWDDYAASIELEALRECAELGRGGLGTMTCWAAGNGGTSDRVDYDPYTSSRYTYAIGAIGDLDREASYNELGSSMLVVTHTSGNSRSITTTTSGSGYTSFFGGTSSASPLGAGAVALAIEANPSLTWRDVQALLVETARINDPADAFWTTNAAGHDINYRFGFGAVDAGVLVSAAETWENMAEEVNESSGLVEVNVALPDNNSTGVTRTVEIAGDITIESVVLNMNVSTNFVGDLRVVMTSPSGTESIFSEPRGFDSSNDINDHDFMSLRCWGEDASGTWAVKVSDQRSGTIATWDDFTLTVYGTQASPGCNAVDIAEPFGTLDLADVQAFVLAFMATEDAADISEPFGIWDLEDIQTFVTIFQAGCP